MIRSVLMNDYLRLWGVTQNINLEGTRQVQRTFSPS
jgi:hypothetical protein